MKNRWQSLEVSNFSQSWQTFGFCAKILGSLVFVVCLLQVPAARACTCFEWVNAQQAAQRDDVIVAKVRTVKYEARGRTTIEIQETLQGRVDQQTLVVQGQDGLNCNGSVISTTEPWIVLMNKVGNSYQTVSCAASALPIDSQTGKIKIHLGTEMNVTVEELRRVLKFELAPTVKGVDCDVSAQRYIFPYDDPRADQYRFSFSQKLSSQDGILNAELVADLSDKGSRLSTLETSVLALEKNSQTYEMSASLREPFFSQITTDTAVIDTRYTHSGTVTYFSKSTDIDGNETKDGELPHLLHQTVALCTLRVGEPLREMKPY